jgi:UDP-N-acetylglucosamine 4,6-dehydratase
MPLKGNVLITGGTGTLGQAIARTALAERWDCRITIYSRSEYRQALMRAEYPQLRYVLGDVRDHDRLQAAVAGHSVVIHAAAVKRIPEAEAQPDECIAVNVVGTANTVRACIAQAVPLGIFISTDKACAAKTTYGASKLMGEAIIRATPASPTRFVYCRYGNVLGSNGSVIPLWQEQAREGRALTITDSRCTRFFMSERDAVKVIERAALLDAGEGFVPKMGALNIAEMARLLHPGSDLIETGLRSLEKLHEDLIHPDEVADEYTDHFILGRGETGHRYSSDVAPAIAPDALRRMIAEV